MECNGGEAMARIRRELGRTQGELGDALGISKQRVSALERGVTEMSLPMAVRVCAALEGLSGGRREVTLDELAGLGAHGGGDPMAGLPEGLRGPVGAVLAALSGKEGGHGEVAGDGPQAR